MKRFTIQRRIFLYILLLLSFLLTVIIVANYTVFFEFLKRNEMESAASAAQKTKQNIEIVLKLAYDMSNSLGEKSKILGELKRGDLSYHSDAPEINNMLTQLVSLQEYFDEVNIIGDNGAFLSSNPENNLYSVLKKCQLPDDFRGRMDTLFLDTDRKGYYINTNNDTISFISAIQDILTGQYLGIVIIDINKTYLREAFSASSFKNLEKVMIVNRQGKILFSFPYNVYLGEVIEKNPQLLELQATQITGKVFKKDSIVVSDTIDHSDWKLIRIINTDKIFRSVNMLGKITLYIFIIFIIVSLIASLFLSISFTKPILELISEIKNVEKGDLSVSIITNRNDELGELSNSFNKMVVQLRNLINDKVEHQKKKSDMEFQILQAQINPHFLYNTLNSIKFLAVIQNVENISDMTSAIINLLKYNLSPINTLVPLKVEIESIKNYVSIQKYRYGSNFNIEYDIDSNTSKLKILKFIMQPLVENSIFHGFKNYKYGGEIKIHSRIVEDFLTIEVIDNGSGVAFERIEEDDGPSDKMHKGIGLSNVHERIGLYFGPKYGVSLKSETGVGTVVTIRLPVIKNESDYKGEAV